MIEYHDTLEFGADRPILVMDELCKNDQLGSTQLCVLREIDLTIHSGEYVAIMGPSGSGKSIRLYIIGCLDRPSSGDCFLGGQRMAQLDDDELSSIRRARIGFIFQSFNLIAQLNVIENISIRIYPQGFTEQHNAERARELAGLVGPAHRVDHRPSEHRGDQQQRVAIARALGNDPLIILADEPTGNLDSASGADILAILDREGKILIVVTHDEHIAIKAERVIRLSDGRIANEEIDKR